MSKYIFYVTNQRRYAQLAQQSAESVKRHTSVKVQSILFSVGEFIDEQMGFDLCVNIPNDPAASWWRKQTLAMTTIIDHFQPTDRILYLDCDTYAIGDVAPIFDLLKIADFVGVHSPRRYIEHPVNADIPRSFAEYNIGVNGMIPNSQVYKLWQKAGQLFTETGDESGCDDQVVLQAALWWMLHEDPQFRILTMPSEWNLRFNMPCSAGKEVVILHGVADDLEMMGRQANSDRNAIRGWPKLGWNI